MAEHLLHAAQISAMRQQVAGEGMAQDVRADLPRVETAAPGEVLQHLPETLPGQVSGIAARREQPTRVLAFAQEAATDRLVGVEGPLGGGRKTVVGGKSVC